MSKCLITITTGGKRLKHYQCWLFYSHKASCKPVFNKYVSVSLRQDLFVILRDFSGLTQILIPQEEVRMETTKYPNKVSVVTFTVHNNNNNNNNNIQNY